MPRVREFCASNIARLLLGVVIVVALAAALGVWLFHSPGHGTSIEQPTHATEPLKYWRLSQKVFCIEGASMARPMWSGTIQISLVGFAVEIYPATSSTRAISFHEVDRNTLTRVRRESVSAGPAPAEDSADADALEEAPETSAKHNSSLHLAPSPADNKLAQSLGQETPQQHTVDRADIVKGYEYEKGKYAIIEPAELKNLRLAGKKTIEISQFSKACEIDPALYEKPYFVMPKAGPQATAFQVVRQSMADSGMVGVGEIVFSGRQHLMTLAPPHNLKQPGMMLYTMRFAAELRDAGDYATATESTPADKAQLALAKQLIDAYTDTFEVSKFKDHYEEALRELVDAKMNNLPVPQPEVEQKTPKVVDLMEALRKSLAQRAPTPASSPAETSKASDTRKKTAATGTAKAKPAPVASRGGPSKKTKSA
jgi:DNA end-binding protein Ku